MVRNLRIKFNLLCVIRSSFLLSGIHVIIIFENNFFLSIYLFFIAHFDTVHLCY